MRYILIVLVVLFVLGCVPEPAFDCTDVDKERVDNYMKECADTGTPGFQCVRNANRLFCKPVWPNSG